MLNLNSSKARHLINNFTQDLVELVREGLLEEVNLRLAAKTREHLALPAPKSKRLASKPTPKALKGRVRISAQPALLQLTSSNA